MNKDQYLQSEGTFDGIVIEQEGGWLRESKEKRTPFIAIPIEVVGQDVDAGKTIIWQGWLSDKAFNRTIETLKDCFGFNGDLNALHEGRQTFVGMQVSFTTEFEEFEGKRRCKVKWLNRAGYVHSVKAMDDATAKVLLAGFQKRAMQVAASFGSDPNPTLTQPKQKPGLAALKAVVENDDVPF